MIIKGFSFKDTRKNPSGKLCFFLVVTVVDDGVVVLRGETPKGKLGYKIMYLDEIVSNLKEGYFVVDATKKWN